MVELTELLEILDEKGKLKIIIENLKEYA